MSAAIVRVMGFCCAVWVAADKADLLDVGFLLSRDYTTCNGKAPCFTMAAEVMRPRGGRVITTVLTPRTIPCIILCSPNPWLFSSLG
jgi:hypothetical protein